MRSLPASPAACGKAQRLYHDAERYFRAPGCATCIDLERCGGLNTHDGLLDCRVHCCGGGETCRWVCRGNPQFREQVQEIGGFGFDKVKIAATPPAAQLPRYVAQLYHGSVRAAPFSASVVALKLAQIFDKRSGAPLVATRDELIQRFMVSPTARIIVTGVDKDPVIERWWSIGTNARRAMIDHLKAIGVELVTVPNYTLSVNWPRTGDLAAMKRIILCYAEMMAGGLPAALHVNGRTPTDFARWRALLVRETAISCLAYEFTTGAAHGRREQHIAWLKSLAAGLDRKLDIILFGDMRAVTPLSEVFDAVTWIDTTSFMKTVHRRRAQRFGNGRLHWPAAPTASGESLHELLAHNCHESETYFALRTAA